MLHSKIIQISAEDGKTEWQCSDSAPSLSCTEELMHFLPSANAILHTGKYLTTHPVLWGNWTVFIVAEDKAELPHPTSHHLSTSTISCTVTQRIACVTLWRKISRFMTTPRCHSILHPHRGASRWNNFFLFFRLHDCKKNRSFGQNVSKKKIYHMRIFTAYVYIYIYMKPTTTNSYVDIENIYQWPC